MLKIVTVIGARPQFVKAAAMKHALMCYKNVEEIIIHTGQHYHDNLSKIFFSELELAKPKYNLNVGSASHGHQTSQMLSRIEDVLVNEKPHCVLVYGDTNSTLAGALAAVKLHIPIVHVEAGLRSYNHLQVEEINRVLTDRISDLLFVPSQDSANNLLKEAVSADKIHIVGDIMYDVAKIFKEKSQASDVLKKSHISSKNYIVATIHRAENTDDIANLQAIVNAFNKLSCEYDLVIPMHPRTQQSLAQHGFSLDSKIKILEPLGFLDMMKLVSDAKLVITDSGGLQKEAFYHKIPCITLRDVTEWVELTQIGWNVVLPPTKINELLPLVEKMSELRQSWQNPYGDGDTAEKIVNVMLEKYVMTKSFP